MTFHHHQLEKVTYTHVLVLLSQLEDVYSKAHSLYMDDLESWVPSGGPCHVMPGSEASAVTQKRGHKERAVQTHDSRGSPGDGRSWRGRLPSGGLGPRRDAPTR